MGDNGEPTIVGWREYVTLPAWGVQGVLAKIDTGARTSALHVADIRDLPGDRVRFEVVLSRNDPTRRIPVEADLVRVARIKPSTGVHQHRRVVLTRMRLGPVEKDIEVSLVCRKSMLCRMLIGRTALDDDFLIDSSRTYIFGKPKRIRRKKSRP